MPTDGASESTRTDGASMHDVDHTVPGGDVNDVWTRGRGVSDAEDDR